MAEPEVIIAEEAGDEDMGEAEEEIAQELGDDGPTGLEDIEPTMPERKTFLEYG